MYVSNSNRSCSLLSDLGAQRARELQKAATLKKLKNGQQNWERSLQADKERPRFRTSSEAVGDGLDFDIWPPSTARASSRQRKLDPRNQFLRILQI